MRTISSLEAVLFDDPVGRAFQSHRQRVTIVSGGQTGVDRAALDVAVENYFPCRGWCPAGRWAEDGRISEKYPLQETGTDDPAVRTELNVIDSDGTLVISKGTPSDGTPLTERMAQKHKRPLLSLNLEADIDVSDFDEWLLTNQIYLLNVAGPRESFAPGKIYLSARLLLERLLVKK